MRTRISLFILLLLLIVSCATNRSASVQYKSQENNHRVEAQPRSSLPCPPANRNAASKVTYKPIKKRHIAPKKRQDPRLVPVNKTATSNPGSVKLTEALVEKPEIFYVTLNPGIPPTQELMGRILHTNNSLPLPIAGAQLSIGPASQDTRPHVELNANVSNNPARDESHYAISSALTEDANEESGSAMIDKRTKMRARLLFFTLISGIAGFLGLGLASIRNKKALQISTWAARNKRSSRILVGILNIFIPVGGFLVGSWLHQLGLDLPAYTKLASIGLLGLTALSYPMVRPANSGFNRHFRRRKFTDLLMVLASIFFFVSVGNNHFSERNSELQQKNLSFSEYQSNITLGENSIASGAQYSRGDWVLDQLKNQEPPRKRKMKPVAIVLLTLLSTALLLTLGYGLAALSCSIACYGYETAAVVLLFGGAAGLITLFIVALKRIFKKAEISQVVSV